MQTRVYLSEYHRMTFIIRNILNSNRLLDLAFQLISYNGICSTTTTKKMLKLNDYIQRKFYVVSYMHKMQVDRERLEFQKFQFLVNSNGDVYFKVPTKESSLRKRKLFINRQIKLSFKSFEVCNFPNKLNSNARQQIYEIYKETMIHWVLFNILPA